MVNLKTERSTAIMAKKFKRRRIAEVFLGGRLYKKRKKKKKKDLRTSRTKQAEEQLRDAGLTEAEIKKLRSKKK